MKKLLSLVMAVIVLFSLFSFRLNKAQAAGLITYAGGQFVWGKGIAFVFDASGYKNKEVRDASIFAGSNFHNLGCTVNKEEEKIVCVARGGLTEYAGQTAIIHLAGHVFYVTIPNMPVRQPGGGGEEEEGEDTGGGESACVEPEVLGADVEFTDIDNITSTEFVAGDTLGEVQASAAESVAADPDLVSFDVVSDLHCGTEPLE